MDLANGSASWIWQTVRDCDEIAASLRSGRRPRRAAARWIGRWTSRCSACASAGWRRTGRRRRLSPVRCGLCTRQAEWVNRAGRLRARHRVPRAHGSAIGEGNGCAVLAYARMQGRRSWSGARKRSHLEQLRLERLRQLQQQLEKVAEICRHPTITRFASGPSGAAPARGRNPAVEVVARATGSRCSAHKGRRGCKEARAEAPRGSCNASMAGSNAGDLAKKHRADAVPGRIVSCAKTARAKESEQCVQDGECDGVVGTVQALRLVF